MNMVRLSLPLLTLLSATVGLTAQDSITLRDGTQIRDVKVLTWNAKEITFKGAKGSDSRAAHLVEDANIESVREALNSTDRLPQSLVDEAEGKKADKLVAPYLLHEAAMGFYDAGKPAEMIATLALLDKSYPDSAFAPEFYRWRIRYYLSKSKPDVKSATKVATDYGDTSRSRPWSEAYSMDADYWKRRIEGVEKKVDPETYISNMQGIVASAGAVAPFVAQAAQIEVADAYRTQKKYEEARKEYQKLRASKGLSPDILARTYIGLGYISLEDAVTVSGEPEKKEALHEAYKNFLKVYLNAEKAHPELVAEGLYNAAKTCEQWNELPSCRQMAGRLRGRLKLREPFMSTSWAKRK